MQDVSRWLKGQGRQGASGQVFRLFGYAGTGKTTLAKRLAENIDGNVSFASLTGNASLVKLNTSRQVTVVCGGTPGAHTNFVIDVVGYYR